jgi:hypothetical protein
MNDDIAPPFSIFHDKLGFSSSAWRPTMFRLSRQRTVVLTGVVLLNAVSVGLGQDAAPTTPPNPPPSPVLVEGASPVSTGMFDGSRDSGFLKGNHDFDRFIGYISNATQNIDPRAQTMLFPIFGAAWASGNSPILPSADAQVYGAGLTVALSDRLSVGLSQGGYAVIDITSDRESILKKLGLPVPQRDRTGQREGWLNLGGFLQYTVIADVERQFIVDAGMRWEAPSGATQVFQGGNNPPYLATYLTAGKELGNWHILATGGFEFACGSGQTTTDTFYLNAHIDRQFGWLYPLVEFNGSCHTSNIDLSLPTGHGVLDLGTFSSAGAILDIAVGANAVLIPNKLEFGAVYVRPIASQDRFDFNSLIVKMVYRF